MRRVQWFHHVVKHTTNTSTKTVIADCALSVSVPRACGRDWSLGQTVGAVKDQCNAGSSQ